jgi:acyl-CoA reductase-like NAD-dependent aldehyde dehydrogenase
MGPVSSFDQYQKIQNFISRGVEQGAQLVCGGEGRPDGLAKGYYVKPTIFANVDSQYDIAQAEIFGPVLCIIPFTSEQQAIDIANDSEFGLSCYISSASSDRARLMAKSIRVGMVHINNAAIDFFAPFGGYKKSGNGREWGQHGLEEFLETKAIMV